MLSGKYVRDFPFFSRFYRGKVRLLLLLLVLLSTKLAQGLLVVFCLFCICRFLVSNKNAELIPVVFVYFVGFEILFIFDTEVVHLWVNT